MRARTIVTVALLSAGCGTSGTPRSSSGAATSSAAKSTVTAVPAPVTAAAVAPAPAPVTAGQLDQLAEEINRTDREDVIARFDHFRPLCDAEGYPLVGNLVSKTSRGGAPIASFCSEVRARSGR